MRFWIRVGDAGDYMAFPNLQAGLAYLNNLSVGKVTGWIDGPFAIGFETPNYHGYDCVSCFWGGADANLARPLSEEERAQVEANLEEVYI